MHILTIMKKLRVVLAKTKKIEGSSILWQALRQGSGGQASSYFRILCLEITGMISFQNVHQE